VKVFMTSIKPTVLVSVTTAPTLTKAGSPGAARCQ
jgi:hypothetical protein